MNRIIKFSGIRSGTNMKNKYSHFLILVICIIGCRNNDSKPTEVATTLIIQENTPSKIDSLNNNLDSNIVGTRNYSENSIEDNAIQENKNELKLKFTEI